MQRLYPGGIEDKPSKWKKWRNRFLLGMSLKQWLVAIPVLLIVAFTLLTLLYYNSFTKSIQNINAARGTIEAHIQRRNNLVIYLVTIVKDYKNYEREIFINLGRIRADVLKQRMLFGNGKEGKLDETLKKSMTETLSQLLAIAEQYPNLKGDITFQKLMSELAATESKIAETREKYNKMVNIYTTRREIFPGIIFAVILRMKDIQSFQASDKAEKIPEIKLK